MTCYRKGGCGPYEGKSCSECPASKESYLNTNRVQEAVKNIRNIPHIHAIDPYPLIPLYADEDGLWYFYTIYHLEQLTKL